MEQNNELKIDQIVRIKGDVYIRKILDIRNGEALTTGADYKTGYIPLNWLEPVSNEELEMYKNKLN